MTDKERDFGFATRTVHAGSRPEPTTGASALPIYQTTSYVFEDTESAAAYLNLQVRNISPGPGEALELFEPVIKN